MTMSLAHDQDHPATASISNENPLFAFESDFGLELGLAAEAGVRGETVSAIV